MFQHTHRHAIRAAQVVAFLEYLRFFLPGPITVVWDRAGIHRARLVFLPASAPELNPVELLWAARTAVT